MNDASCRPIRRALLSVYDKTDLVGLAEALHAAGVEIISTGSTARTVYPGKGRQQRRVGVDHPTAESVQELGADQLEETRADHQVRCVRGHLFGEGAIPVLPGLVVGDGLDEDRDPGRLRPGEPRNSGPVRSDGDHLHPVAG